MAIVNLCGFETGDALEGTGIFGGGGSVASAIKRTGAYSFRSNPVTTDTGYYSLRQYKSSGNADDSNIHPSGNPTYIRFYLYIAALPSAAEGIFQSVGTTVFKFELRIDQNGNLSAVDSALAALGTGSTVLSTATWHRIEVKVGVGASAAWEVLINGIVEISGSTANLLSSESFRARFGKVSDRNGSGYDCYFDDVAVSNSAYPGAGQVLCLRPEADGNYTAWTGVYTDVDDLVSQAGNDGDTTKWSSSTNTQAETAALESCASRGISGTINAVKTITVVKRTSSNTTNIQHRLRVTSPGTADTDLTDYATTASYVLLASVRDVNPSGGAAWDIAGVDSLEVGVEHTTSQSRQADCTMVCAMVDFTAASVAPPIYRNPIMQLIAGGH